MLALSQRNGTYAIGLPPLWAVPLLQHRVGVLLTELTSSARSSGDVLFSFLFFSSVSAWFEHPRTPPRAAVMLNVAGRWRTPQRAALPPVSLASQWRTPQRAALLVALSSNYSHAILELLHRSRMGR